VDAEVDLNGLNLNFSFLDLRLAVRMLVRYPVLTVIGTMSLAFAIAIGASVFAAISLILWPTLPLPDGDRVVSVRLHDDAANEYEDRLTADFLRWQHGTTSLTDFGAGRDVNRNLTMGDGVIEPVDVAEVTPSTFQMARVAPIAGRPLTEEDVSPAAPPVMIIGENLWRSRFGADPALLQRPVTLAGMPTAVVGIMPRGFKFPSTSEVWVPLRLDATTPPRSGTWLLVWARTRRGMSLEQAAAEFDVFRAAASADWPTTHAHLRAEVKPFAGSRSTLEPAERVALASLNIGIGLLVLLISGNVALLMFARAATRESEIVVRTALGASRGRLIRQFFTESLVLSALAAIAGLVLAVAAVRWGIQAWNIAEGHRLPFWFVPGLPPLSIAYGLGLALLAAVVTGVLPALKVTRGLSSRLREAGAGGGGLRFGGVWTALIVAQIAVTVTLPVVTFYVKRDAWQIEAMDIGLPPAQVLSASLGRDPSLSADRYAAAVRQVRAVLAATPGVGRVSIADRLPLMWNGHYVIAVDPGGARPREDNDGGYRVSTAAVDQEFFATFDAAALAGRLFTAADYGRAPRVAVVNRSFVDRVLGGRNAVGRHVQYRAVDRTGQRPPAGTNPPWIEIIGVVRDLGMATEPDPKVAGIYLPLDLRSVSTAYVAARVTGKMTAAMNAVRETASRTEPLLRVMSVQPLSQVTAGTLREIGFLVRLITGVSVSALVLALSGIYAVTSFAVSRRTREIGIRVALGSSRGGVVWAILRAPLVRMSIGIAIGWALAMLLAGLIAPTPAHVAGLFGYVVVMCGICLLACVVPARRALAVDPIEALRAE
jgi:putative ABC transport system permease protein